MSDPQEPGAPQPGETAEQPFVQAEQEEIAHAEAGGGDDPLNGQIAAAVAAAEAAIKDAAAVAAAALAQVVAQSAGLAMLNAVNAQQNAYVTANATVAATVARILSTREIVKQEPADV